MRSLEKSAARRALLLSLLVGCNFHISGDKLQQQCLELSCWNVEQGSIEPTPTWNALDLGSSLVGSPARASLSLPVASNPRCLTLSYDADIALDAQLELQVDYNDDGTAELSLPLLGARWKRQSLLVRTPADFRRLRFRLQKSGPGSAKLARFAVAVAAACDNLPAVTLQRGAQCTLDATCANNRCVNGLCDACGPGGCVEGEACSKDAECMDGACAAGVCRACAKQGNCASSERCSGDAQCASGTCTAGAAPSLTSFPGLDGTCGDCSAHSPCSSGQCVLGRCSACATDADCAAGSVCRYLDAFDALTRGCVAKPSSLLPRGALCERDDECQMALRCGAAEGRAKRCGLACAGDGDCPSGELCIAAGAMALKDAASPFRVLPTWSTPADRIFTCHASVTSGVCELNQQCASSPWPMGCCGGRCTIASVDKDTGSCEDSNAPAPF